MVFLHTGVPKQCWIYINVESLERRDSAGFNEPDCVHVWWCQSPQQPFLFVRYYYIFNIVRCSIWPRQWSPLSECLSSSFSEDCDHGEFWVSPAFHFIVHRVSLSRLVFRFLVVVSSKAAFTSPTINCAELGYSWFWQVNTDTTWDWLANTYCDIH